MDLEVLLIERLELGRKRYGHGVRVNDDTTQFGTPSDSWMHMALEEHLDAVIYIIADYIKRNDLHREEDEDDNQLILYYVCNMDKVYGTHKVILDHLKKVIDLCIPNTKIS